MTTTLQTAAQQALEALEWAVPTGEITLADWMKAATDLRAALAEQADPKLRYDGLHEYAAQHRLNYNDLCRVVRAALAEPVQEPVAWMDIDSDGQRLAVRQWSDGNREEVPLYAAPPQREPAGFKMVPLEPTPEMAKAGCYRYCAAFVKDYKAMIAAAPAALAAAVAEPVASVTECEACFTPDVCQLRGTCDHYAAERLRVAAPPQRKPLAESTQEPVALETVYETIIHWDEGGGKRSRRELARRIVALYAAPPQRKPLTDAQLRTMFEIGEQE